VGEHDLLTRFIDGAQGSVRGLHPQAWAANFVIALAARALGKKTVAERPMGPYQGL
jgi:hypothetical protein